MENMINFNPDFLLKKSFFKAQDLELIDNQIDFLKLDRGEKSLFDKLCFDFIYTSAKIEGNTYTKIEAETLLSTNKTAGYKSLDEAHQLLNIKRALDYVLDYKPEINKTTIKEIHQILSENLLPKQDQGNVRKTAVTIGKSDYIPLSIPDQLELNMDNLIQNYKTMKNPFDKALYIHNNIAYLQYFQDCNKRLARILQNLSLLHTQKMLFAFTYATQETIDKYKKSLISYYEKGDFLPSKKFFIDEYQKTLELTYHFKPEFRIKRSGSRGR